jgi:hypothetical protein
VLLRRLCDSMRNQISKESYVVTHFVDDGHDGFAREEWIMGINKIAPARTCFLVVASRSALGDQRSPEKLWSLKNSSIIHFCQVIEELWRSLVSETGWLTVGYSPPAFKKPSVNITHTRSLYALSRP